MKYIKYYKDLDIFGEEWDENEIKIEKLELIKMLINNFDSKYKLSINNDNFVIPNDINDDINFNEYIGLPYLQMCSKYNCIDVIPFDDGNKYLLLTYCKRKIFVKNDIDKIILYIKKMLKFSLGKYFCLGDGMTYDPGPR